MDILEIELQTCHLEETEDFYSKQLGLEIIKREKTSVSFQAGLSVLTFIKSIEINPKYHFAFNIPQNKLDEAIIWISNKATLIKNNDNSLVTNFTNWNAKAIYFYDNNGNIIEFIARFDLANISAKVFDSYSIQSISEVGVVTDNPLIFAETLLSEYQLVYFTKGPKTGDFVALGDDNGLIIISSPTRSWYPTKSLAEKHYFKMKILSDHSERLIVVNEKNASS